ncbi:MAG: zinc transporter ZupT [Candidatus Thermoplasmatota archaeon]|nr:zinc transporter ZupT [Candidatus Thermoplasmatota archaeon]
MIESANIPLAFLLTTIAGLSTGIGGLIVFIIKKPKLRFLSPLLGFAAGVMIYVSLVELLLESIEGIGFLQANSSFFIGIIFMFILDRFVPHLHINRKIERFQKDKIPTFDNKTEKRLKEASILTLIGITLHNFPEGVAVFSISLLDISLGIPIAIAIAVHNIPEGIAVAVPIFYSTKSRKKGFFYAFLSGLAEPMGALLGFLFLYPFLTEGVLNGALAFVGGIMVFISFDELLPIARDYGNEHTANLGLFLGMFVMMFTLVFL